MIRKIVSFAGAAALLLGAATPAMASFQWWDFGGSSTTNTANVTSNVSALSNTGENSQMGKSNWLMTGDAWAGATGVVVTNTNVNDCGCENQGDLTNTATVRSTVSAQSNTGANSQYSFGGFWHHSHGGNAAVTGGAGSEATGWVITNTNLTGF